MSLWRKIGERHHPRRRPIRRGLLARQCLRRRHRPGNAPRMHARWMDAAQSRASVRASLLDPPTPSNAQIGYPRSPPPPPSPASSDAPAPRLPVVPRPALRTSASAATFRINPPESCRRAHAKSFRSFRKYTAPAKTQNQNGRCQSALHTPIPFSPKNVCSISASSNSTTTSKSLRQFRYICQAPCTS